MMGSLKAGFAGRVAIRKASDADAETVVNLWEEASAWLRARGSEQWQYPVKIQNVYKAMDEGVCWIVEDDEANPLATVTLDEHADPDLWRSTDEPEQALYVHRLVVGLNAREHELGSAILDWSSMKAVVAGKRWLRFDVWTSNLQLRQYYLDRRFSLVRIVPDIEYGTLFQRPAGIVLGRGPTVAEWEACSRNCSRDDPGRLIRRGTSETAPCLGDGHGETPRYG